MKTAEEMQRDLELVKKENARMRKSIKDTFFSDDESLPCSIFVDPKTKEAMIEKAPSVRSNFTGSERL